MKETSVHFLIPYERPIFLVLRQKGWLAGDVHFYLKFCAKLARLLKNGDFQSIFACKVKQRRRIYIALYYKLLTSKALRYDPRVTRGSHSFTCHPHTNHTCFYSPAARHHRPLAGTHCAYPRRDGQAELTYRYHIPR